MLLRCLLIWRLVAVLSTASVWCYIVSTPWPLPFCGLSFYNWDLFGGFSRVDWGYGVTGFREEDHRGEGPFSSGPRQGVGHQRTHPVETDLLTWPRCVCPVSPLHSYYFSLHFHTTFSWRRQLCTVPTQGVGVLFPFLRVNTYLDSYLFLNSLNSFFLFGHVYGIWKCPHYGSDLNHSSDNARSLTARPHGNSQTAF